MRPYVCPSNCLSTRSALLLFFVVGSETYKSVGRPIRPSIRLLHFAFFLHFWVGKFLFEYAPAQIMTAPAKRITAPAQLITAPAQLPATGVVSTALLNYGKNVSAAWSSKNLYDKQLIPGVRTLKCLTFYANP